MKQLIILLLAIGLFSCTQKILQQSSFEGMCYESNKGHLFAGNQFCFYPNNAFKYIGHGPSIFISSGNWKYIKSSNEIELTSNAANIAISFKNRVDTMWIDLTGKRIKVKNKKQFLFDKIIYSLK
jgi:hypothetical protein